MWWAVAWLIVVAAFLFTVYYLWPTPGELCLLEGGRWMDLGNGLTACIG